MNNKKYPLSFPLCPLFVFYMQMWEKFAWTIKNIFKKENEETKIIMHHYFLRMLFGSFINLFIIFYLIVLLHLLVLLWSDLTIGRDYRWIS